MITDFQLQSKFKPFHKAGKPIYITSDGFIIAGDGESINYVNTENLQLLKTLNKEKEIVTCFVANPNDYTVILANKDLQMRRIDRFHSDRRAKVWNSLHSAPVFVMSLNSTSTRLATGSSDNKVRIWHLGENEGNSYSCSYHKSKITVLQNHPTKSMVVSVSMVDYDIAAWNTDNGRLLGVFTGHQKAVTAIDFHPASDKMFSASHDQSVMIWDSTTFARLNIIPVKESIDACIMWRGDSNSADDGNVRLMIGGERGVMSIVDVTTRRIVQEFSKKALFSNDSVTEINNEKNESSLRYIRSIVPTTDGVVVVRESDNIEWYDGSSMSLRHELVGEMSALKDVVMVAGDRMMIALESTPYLRLFDCEKMLADEGDSEGNCDSKCTQWPSQLIAGGHSAEIMTVATFDNGRMVVSGGKDGRLCVWKLDESDIKEKMKLVTTFDFEDSIVSCVSADQKGERIYCSLKSSADSIAVLSFHENLLTKLCDIFKPHEGIISSMDINCNSDMLATGSKDKLAKIWKYNNKKRQLMSIGICKGHRRGIWSVKFSALEKILLSSSMDKTIKLWSLENFDCIMSLQSESVIYKALFSQNEQQIISCDDDGQVSIWSCEKQSVTQSVKLDEDCIQALNFVHNKDGDVSGFVAAGESSLICFYKDVSKDQIAVKAKSKELHLNQQQELENLLAQEQFVGAFKLAINLNKPMEAFKILNKIQQNETKTVQLQSPLEISESSAISEAFRTLNEEELKTLLQFATKWISNSKTFVIAKDVFVFILCTVPNADLCRNPDFVKHLERNKAHAYKQYIKTKAAVEKVGLFDYLSEVTVVKGIENLGMDVD